jgi:hypothetical protein
MVLDVLEGGTVSDFYEQPISMGGALSRTILARQGTHTEMVVLLRRHRRLAMLIWIDRSGSEIVGRWR